MSHEIDIYGVFVPDLLLLIVAAFLVGVPVRRLLALTGVYRLVWHRPLFDAALTVLILGGLVAAAHRALP